MQHYLEQVHAEAFEHANDPETGGLRLNAIVTVLLDHLEEAGIITGAQGVYYRHEAPNLAAEVHGYAYDSDEDVVSLFYCIDGNADTPLGASPEVNQISKADVDRGFRRLESFVRMVRNGRIDNVDESQTVTDLIQLIGDDQHGGLTFDLHVLVTGSVSERAVRSDGEGNREVWDLLRLERTCGVGGHDRLSIDFVEEFGDTLPCLVTPEADDGIQVLLTCIPGPMLAKIYNTYRARLLERNVRSFLQFTGKVNKGIRDTILNAPGRFLPYNNGLAATAAEADVEHLEGGLARIRAVRDFQIVNGGQTTASIASCVRRDKADLNNVTVTMKLTIVPQDHVDQLVPLISRFANTQNRIQEADFSANHPWHIELEKLSRNTWTRATSDAPRGTRWFYERSRGQYQDALGSNATPAGRKRFRAENPSAQKLTKTDLAKYLMSWDQRPAVVSRGAQKCFMAFMAELTRNNRPQPNTEEFRRIVAQSILFRKAEKLYGELGHKGYRAQVVTYAVGRLSHALERRLPWEEIWANQALPERLLTPLKTVIRGVREVIVQPPGNRNITEWCKREECWSAVLNLRLELDLPEVEEILEAPVDDGPAVTEEQAAMITTVTHIPADVWFAVAAWGKQTNSLQPWQRSLSYSIGRLLGLGRSPSPKQATQGGKLLCAAWDLGFTHEELTPHMMDRL